MAEVSAKSARISRDTYCLHGNGSHRCHSDRYGSLPGMQHTLGLQAKSAMLLTTDLLVKEAVASEGLSRLIKQPLDQWHPSLPALCPPCSDPPSSKVRLHGWPRQLKKHMESGPRNFPSPDFSTAQLIQ